MIPSAPKEILRCVFPEDASQFSASECDQSDEETIEKKQQTIWYSCYIFLVQINVFEIKNGVKQYGFN